MAKVTKLKTKRSHSDSVLAGLASLRTQEKYTDVTLICELKEIPAHRLVLHASSPYFQNIFENDENLDRIVIDAIEPSVIEDVISFLYTGELVKSNSLSVFDSHKAVLAAARTLELSSLSDFCWKELSKLLTVEFYKDLWDLAEQYANDEFITQIVTLVAKNFVSVCRKREFLILKASQLKMVLQDSESTNTTADWMLNGILQWVKHDESERQISIVELVTFVKVECLSSNYLAHVLNSETLVTDNRDQFHRLFAIATSRLADTDTKPDVTQLPAVQPPIPAKRNSRKSSTAMTPIPEVVLGDTQDAKHDDIMEYLDGKILACCGKDDGNDTIVIYDFKKKTWGQPRKLPFVVASGTAVVSICGFIYYIGGDEGNNVGSYAVHKFHPATFTGTEVCDLEVAVTQAGAAATHDKIYAIGGVSSNQMVNYVQRYDPETDEWVSVASTNCPHGLPNVVVLYEEIYVVGSYCCPVVETYYPSRDQWTVITQIQHPLNEKWPRAIAHQDRIWVWTDLKEQKFHVYDVLCNEWEEKKFNGGPKVVYGMWSTCSTVEQLEFIVCSAPGNTFFVYHSESDLWLPMAALPSNSTCYYWQTVLA